VALIFAFGIVLMLVAPLLCPYHKGSSAFVGGALIVLVVFGLVHPDARMGQEAVESNRRFNLTILAFEFPVQDAYHVEAPFASYLIRLEDTNFRNS